MNSKKRESFDLTDCYSVIQRCKDRIPKQQILEYVLISYLHLLNFYERLVVRIYDSEFHIFSKKVIIEQKVLEL